MNTVIYPFNVFGVSFAEKILFGVSSKKEKVNAEATLGLILTHLSTNSVFEKSAGSGLYNLKFRF